MRDRISPDDAVDGLKLLGEESGPEGGAKSGEVVDVVEDELEEELEEPEEPPKIPILTELSRDAVSKCAGLCMNRCAE